jgi:hypothetical protein
LISQSAFSTFPAFILFFFIFILKKEIDFWGITQNWVMTSIERILSLLSSSAMVIFVPQLMKLGMLSLVFSSS